MEMETMETKMEEAKGEMVLMKMEMEDVIMETVSIETKVEI